MQNLRALASKVVSACREKGLKQSVVMDVLAKSSGYRSIQCAESNSQSDGMVTLEEKIVLRTLLFQSDLDYIQDLPITLFDVAGQDRINAGDPVFEWMWSLTELGFVKMLSKLIAINSTFGLVYDYISKHGGDAVALQTLREAFPETLANYIEVESIEGEREVQSILLPDVSTPVYNAIVCLLEFNKKQNLFIKEHELFTIHDKELGVSAIMDGKGSVLATYTRYGFDVSDSSIWAQKSWYEDQMKVSGIRHVGKPTLDFEERFIDAVVNNSAGKVSTESAILLTTLA